MISPIALKNISLLGLSPLLLAACATPSTVIETDDISRVNVAHKKSTITEIGQFNFDKRVSIHKSIDELSRMQFRYPKRIVLKTTHTNTFEERPVLKLIDRDGDDHSDQFVYIQKDARGWDTPDYGFMYDLNSDGKIDYIVFNQGIVHGKDESNPFKFVHTLYHWIDTNNDGIIDIWVYPDIDLDEDGMVDDEVYGWLYDSNNDGLVDSGEYIGPTIKQVINVKAGVVNIKRYGHESTTSVNKNMTNIQELSNKVLADINNMI